MHSALLKTEHRPWPMPDAAWTWRQSWLDLAFAHWRVPAEVLQPHIPNGLTLQQWDGSAWLGVVPFRMTHVMRRPLPDLPWISAFPEINVRTYVEHGDKPGVWFLSLDATNPLAVWAAKRFFNLPYYRADIRMQLGPEIAYHSVRRGGGEEFKAEYAAIGDVCMAAPGTLEHWLTERYCLYAQDPKGRLYRTEVQHAPWPLRPARLKSFKNTMLEPFQIALEGEPVCHFAEGVDVVVWSPDAL